ncbi:MAG: DUF2148 domain-containing protein [Candidatus Bathyarchaeia archaeon]
MSPIIKSKEGEKEAIIDVARLMQVAARTAPKTRGVDDVLTLIVYGAEKNAIAEKMREMAKERSASLFERDAISVENSEAVVLIGVRGDRSPGLNCGACGSKDCREFEEKQKKVGQDFMGPTCVFKALDLGIALGSAAKIASILNIDNRIMYHIGAAAMKLKLIPEATIIIGIPLSSRGKNIYFDRRWP